MSIMCLASGCIEKAELMPAYLISYSTAMDQTSANLDELMAALGAVPLGDCLCGLEMDLELDAFREWLTG